MTANVLKVGMREFRAHLPQYVLTSVPVAINRIEVKRPSMREIIAKKSHKKEVL